MAIGFSHVWSVAGRQQNRKREEEVTENRSCPEAPGYTESPVCLWRLSQLPDFAAEDIDPAARKAGSHHAPGRGVVAPGRGLQASSHPWDNGVLVVTYLPRTSCHCAQDQSGRESGR